MVGEPDRDERNRLHGSGQNAPPGGRNDGPALPENQEGEVHLVDPVPQHRGGLKPLRRLPGKSHLIAVTGLGKAVVGADGQS